MTFRDYIVSAFDGVTLHNGTTLRAVNRIAEVSRARTQIVTLPSGAKYDNMQAGDVAPQIPGLVTQEIIVGDQTWAVNQSTFGTIAGKLGVRGTLTFKRVDNATTYTATARMTGIRNLTQPTQLNTAGIMKIAVTFELLTNPA